MVFDVIEDLINSTKKSIEDLIDNIDIKNIDYEKIATDYLNLHNIEYTDKDIMFIRNVLLLGVNIGLRIAI